MKSRTRSFRLFLQTSFLLASMLVASRSTLGATIHVADDVTTSGDGTSWARAKKTIQEGINAVENGDEVIVSPGRYFENIAFGEKNIVLRSTDPLNPGVVSSTIIDGGRKGATVSIGHRVTTGVLSGFTITGGYYHWGGGINGDWNSGGNNATIENNIIRGNIAGGGSMWSPSGGGYAYGYGGGLNGCSGVIQNNIITSNSAQSLSHQGIVRRAADNKYWGGAMFGCDGIIQNNSIWGNFAANGGGGLRQCDGTIKNNIIWGNGPDEQVITSSTPIYCCIEDWGINRWEVGEGNITLDPLLVDPANGDFHLLPNSPCIDAGTSLSAQRDFEGDARPYDGASEHRGDGSDFDMGADEYWSPATPRPEAITDLITGFYRAILGREPEIGAVASWKTGYFEYALGFDIDVRFIPREIARLLFLSDEYAARGRTDGGFLTDCYNVILRRSPSQSEIDNWLAGEWSRSQVMTIFSESEEFANRIQMMYPGKEGDSARNFVTFMYVGLLDRLVDQSGLEYASELFDTAFSQNGIEGVRSQAKQMAREVILSVEFLNKQPTSSDYVIRFYRSFMGRFPSDAEVTYWSGELDSGRQTHDSVIDLFADSAEFSSRLEEYFEGL
ncbi:MAG TPA: DUF4214 domain-containing protein [Sumerlaeia bacterium]|nr:DUF4214 domain-containing protein [Sumerlaeia bacterium]